VQQMTDTPEQQVESILRGIQREASLADCYYRLANSAPDQIHKQNILYALECKQTYLNYFTNLYVSFTGKQPEYPFNRLFFHTYDEGLYKAHQAEAEGCKDYYSHCIRSQNPYVQQAFRQAFNQKQENAARIGWLKKRVTYNIKDYGGNPYVVNIDGITKQNKTFRTALWTGDKLQVTLMSIGVGEDIGLENHPNTDQFIRIEEGQGLVQMGDSPDHLTFQAQVYDDFAIMIPAGTWHNITNTGNKPMKVYSIYAPPEHPFGTIHKTKADAEAAEHAQQGQ
jgi:mannose-6-phosphate isomerase-like protein (cupin superfamily)